MLRYEFVFLKKFNGHKPGAVQNIVSGFKDQLARHVTHCLLRLMFMMLSIISFLFLRSPHL